jgi:O-acetyl-ADP-ribose deacetylase (regulator of RNase III)
MQTKFHLVVEGPRRNLHPILQDEIYRIAREAVRNAFRHARRAGSRRKPRIATGCCGCASGLIDAAWSRES